MKTIDATSTETWLPTMESDLNELLRPELSSADAARLYVVAQSQLENPELESFGVYSEVIASVYRNEIGNRWEGNGPGMLIGDLNILRETEREGRSSSIAVRDICETAIHEAGHVLVETPMFLVPPTSRSFTQRARASIQTFTGTYTDAKAFPRGGHTPEWARITLHLAWRMQCRGWPVDFDGLWYCCATGLWRPTTLSAALSEEFTRLADVPLGQLCRHPAPAYFNELLAISAKAANHEGIL